MKKSDRIQMRMDSAAFEGKSIGRFEEIPVFVKYAAPGDVVDVTIINKKKGFAEGKLEEIVSSGPDRISPVCEHFTECGGCQWQHVSYAAQAKFKGQKVKDLVQRIGGLKDIEPEPVLASDRPFHYRNKMEYTFSDRVWIPASAWKAEDRQPFVPPAGGLHAPGRFDKILDLNACYLPGKESFEILNVVRNFARKHQIPGYDTVSHTGFFRNLIVRNSEKTGEWLAALVTAKSDDALMEALAAELQVLVPQLTTFIHIVNATKSPNHAGFGEKIYFGRGFIEDEVGGFLYRIHPLAFFQTNIRQANVLFGTAISDAMLKADDVVYDLYCGVGTLSFMAAKHAKKVIGIELSEEAIANARFNAGVNGIDNTTFFQGDMKDVFVDSLLAQHGKPDVIITDPPRAGMHPDVVKTILDIAPDRLIYVSCNPATMARDLKEFDAKYVVEKIQPVDMFPQTYHIECVAKMTLRK